MEERERGISARHHQRNVIWLRLLHDHAGERVLLAPHLDVDRHRGPEVAAVEVRCGVEAGFYPGEGGGLAHPPGVVGDPLERDFAGLAHIGEQPSGCALILGLVLRDHAQHGELVEDLPQRLRMALLENGLDGVPDGAHRRLGAAMPFRLYVLRYIKSVACCGGRMIEPDPGRRRVGSRRICELHGSRSRLIALGDAFINPGEDFVFAPAFSGGRQLD